MEKSDDGFKSVRLPQLYVRTQFTVSATTFVSEEDVPANTVSLKTATNKQSIKQEIRIKLCILCFAHNVPDGFTIMCAYFLLSVENCIYLVGRQTAQIRENV
jgi:zinc transporter ZupT